VVVQKSAKAFFRFHHKRNVQPKLDGFKMRSRWKAPSPQAAFKATEAARPGAGFLFVASRLAGFRVGLAHGTGEREREKNYSYV